MIDAQHYSTDALTLEQEMDMTELNEALISLNLPTGGSKKVRAKRIAEKMREISWYDPKNPNKNYSIDVKGVPRKLEYDPDRHDYGSFLNYLVDRYTDLEVPPWYLRYVETARDIAIEIIKKSTKKFLNKQYFLDGAYQGFTLLHACCGLTMNYFMNIADMPLNSHIKGLVRIDYVDLVAGYYQNERVAGIDKDFIILLVRNGADMFKKDAVGVTPHDVLYGYYDYIQREKKEGSRFDDEFMNLDLSLSEKVEVYKRCTRDEKKFLDFIDKPIQKLQALFRGNKKRLDLNAKGIMTKKTKRKHWSKLKRELLKEGFGDVEIKDFYDNHYMKSSSSSTRGKSKKYDRMLKRVQWPVIKRELVAVGIPSNLIDEYYRNELMEYGPGSHTTSERREGEKKPRDWSPIKSEPSSSYLEDIVDQHGVPMKPKSKKGKKSKKKSKKKS